MSRALLVLAACGRASEPAPPPQTGHAPAVDALIQAIATGDLAKLVTVGEPIAAPLQASGLTWLLGAHDHVVGLDAHGTATVWDAKSARPLGRYATLPDPVHVAISPDGARLVVCGAERSAVLELAGGRLRPMIQNVPIVGCGFLPDQRLVIVTTELIVFDGKTLQQVDDQGTGGTPASLAIGPAGTVAVARTDGRVWRWSGKGGDPPTIVDAHADRTAPIAFGPRERYLYQVIGDAMVTWQPDALDQPPQPSTLPPGAPFRDWVTTPRGLVDPDTGAPVLAIPDATAAFADQVAALHADGTAELWTFGGILVGHSQAITAIVPHGDRVLTTGLDGLALIWRDGQIAVRLPRGPQPLLAADWVDDDHVAVRDATSGRIYQVSTGAQTGTTDLPLSSATSAQTGEWTITGDAHGQLRLRPVTIEAAVARACGLVRRFDRLDETDCR